MFELIREAFSLHNLPVSALLGMVLLYWLLVIVGVLDNDFDATDLGDGGDHQAMGAAVGGSSSSKRWKRLGFVEVPLSISGSFLALFMWVISMLANYYANGTPGNRSTGLAFVYLFPNLFVSLGLTRLAIMPFQRVFDAMNKASSEAEAVMGREGRVVSSQVDARYGQVEISTGAVPLLINARTEDPDLTIPKGAIVQVTAGTADDHHYLVRPVALSESILNPD